MSTRLSVDEISNKELNIDFGYRVSSQSYNTQRVLLKILDAVETDIISISDGEVIDMIHSFLNSIGIQKARNEEA